MGLQIGGNSRAADGGGRGEAAGEEEETEGEEAGEGSRKESSREGSKGEGMHVHSLVSSTVKEMGRFHL